MIDLLLEDNFWTKDKLKKQLLIPILTMAKKYNDIEYIKTWGSWDKKDDPNDLDVVIKLNRKIDKAGKVEVDFGNFQDQWAPIKNLKAGGYQYPLDITLVDNNDKAYVLFGRKIWKNKKATLDFKKYIK